ICFLGCVRKRSPCFSAYEIFFLFAQAENEGGLQAPHGMESGCDPGVTRQYLTVANINDYQFQSKAAADDHPLFNNYSINGSLLLRS
ncbi:MAG: hypothetical protein ACK41O_27155, partial [Runella zeae]